MRRAVHAAVRQSTSKRCSGCRRCRSRPRPRSMPRPCRRCHHGHRDRIGRRPAGDRSGLGAAGRPPIVTSPVAKPVTISLKTAVKAIGLALVGSTWPTDWLMVLGPVQSTVTVGAFVIRIWVARGPITRRRESQDDRAGPHPVRVTMCRPRPAGAPGRNRPPCRRSRVACGEASDRLAERHVEHEGGRVRDVIGVRTAAVRAGLQVDRRGRRRCPRSRCCRPTSMPRSGCRPCRRRRPPTEVITVPGVVMPVTATLYVVGPPDTVAVLVPPAVPLIVMSPVASRSRSR